MLVDLAKEIQDAVAKLRLFIATHRYRKYLAIVCGYDTVVVVRFRPAKWSDHNGWYWHANVIRPEAEIELATRPPIILVQKTNDKLALEFPLLQRKSDSLTDEEIEEVVALELLSSTETDYRPAEGIPEDYYAG